MSRRLASITGLIVITLIIAPMLAQASLYETRLEIRLEEKSSERVTLGVYIRDVRVGYFALVFKDNIEICHYIELAYSFSREDLRRVLGFEVEEVYVYVEWTITSAEPYKYWYGDHLYYDVRKGFSEVVPLTLKIYYENLDLRIDVLTATLTVVGEERGYAWRINIGELLAREDVKLVYSRDLSQVTIKSIHKQSGINWLRYELMDGRGSRARIDVVAYPSFDRAVVLRVAYADDPLTRGLNPRVLEAKIYGLADGRSFNTTLTLKSGEAVLIPGDLPGDLALSREIIVTSLILELKWMSRFRVFNLAVLNVTETTGVISIHPVIVDKAFILPSRLLKVENIGRGWVTVYIGVNSTLNGVDTRVRFQPDEGSPEASYLRVATIRNYMNHSLVYKVYMLFEKPGRVSGTIVIERRDPERPWARFEEKIVVEVKEGSPLEARDSDIVFFAIPLSRFIESEISIIEWRMRRGVGGFSDLQRLAELKRMLEETPGDAWVIVADVDAKLSWEKWLDIRLMLRVEPSDYSKPVEIVVAPEVLERGVSLNGARFRYLACGEWSGYTRIPMMKASDVTLDVKIGYQREEFIDGRISWDNLVERIIIYVYNAREVKIISQNVMIVAGVKPRSEPRVSIVDLGFEETPVAPEREAREILLALFLALATAILVSLLVAEARRILSRL